MTQDVAIQCRNVSKRFILDTSGALWKLLRADTTAPSYTALSSVSFDVARGELVGILGRNGAGKSTLLRTVGGVHTPDSGTIRVNGSLAGLYELGISGNDHLNGAGFAQRWFEIAGDGSRPSRALIDEVRDFSEIGDAFERPIWTYSSGMKARLFFAVATALPSDVYVIDELLSVGDEYFQSKCWRRMRERLTGGASGLLATHDWSAILRLCPTCIILENGRVRAQGPSPAVIRDYLGTKVDEFAAGAKFAPSLPTDIHVTSGMPLTATFSVVQTAVGTLCFGASIERFVTGYGWEHVLHLPPTEVAERPGLHDIVLHVPELPLPAATYSLGLFLTLADTAGTRHTVDVRSWTYDNALSLRVDGTPGRGAVRLPITIGTA